MSLGLALLKEALLKLSIYSTKDSQNNIYQCTFDRGLQCMFDLFFLEEIYI